MVKHRLLEIPEYTFYQYTEMYLHLPEYTKIFVIIYQKTLYSLPKYIMVSLE